MGEYAQIDENNIVFNIIVIDEENIATGLWGDPSTLINLENPRRNGASPGYRYHPDADEFSPPQSYPSWIFDTETYVYNPPVPYPIDGEMYIWEEALQEWRLPL